jgi:polar amino acid transport system permease protein
MNGFDLFAILLNPGFGQMLLDGMKMTAVVAGCSWLTGMTLAMLLLTVRLTGSWGERLVAGYVSYHSNVPTLVQLMLWYFGIASMLPVDWQGWLSEHHAEAVFAIIGLSLCQAAYFSEDLRSGLRGVPSGQTEAARALGHSYLSCMRHVLLPQAARNALPALVNHSVSLFKNSSLAMAIGVAELTHAVKEIENQSFRTFESYAIATTVYLLCSLLIMAAGALIAQRSHLAATR